MTATVRGSAAPQRDQLYSWLPASNPLLYFGTTLIYIPMCIVMTRAFRHTASAPLPGYLLHVVLDYGQMVAVVISGITTVNQHTVHITLLSVFPPIAIGILWRYGPRRFSRQPESGLAAAA